MSDEVGWDVSRETSADLLRFKALVQKWSPKINLVSKADLENLDDRHIADSIQVAQLAGVKGTWLDIGAGGGFPGIVVAILAKNRGIADFVTLVESDVRKATFLRTAVRELNLPAEVISQRIEECAPQNADYISARALAPLTELLEMAAYHGHEQTVCLFPKGSKWREEVETARNFFHFSYDPIASKTEPQSAVLRVKEITRE